MLNGIIGLDDVSFDARDWGLLTELTVEQMQLRIHMRNAQFSHPLSERRVREICTGSCDPMPFDYAKAGLTAVQPAPPVGGS